MLNHYKIKTPFSVQFSGGESSAFMLKNILDAYDGFLPPDSRVLFANTGLEHPKTLEFVQRVEEEWNVPIRWIEYDLEHKFKVVQPETASRNGEPFDALLDKKGYVPTPVARVCTVNLKMRAMAAYLMSLGWDDWDAAIGLRADEPKRAQRIQPDNKRETPVCPMYQAGHTLDDVENFWRSQPWRLEIPRWMGNCCGCFLKSRGRIEMVGEEDPSLLEWWAKAEERIGKPFRIDRPNYRQLLTQITIQGRLYGDDGSTLPCSCTD